MTGSDGADAASPDPVPPRRREVFESALVAGAVIAGALSTGWPENGLQWILLVTAAVLGGLAPRGPLRVRLRAGLQPVLRRLRPRRLRRPLVLVVVVVVAAGLGRLLLLSPDVTAWASARLFGCPNPTQVQVLATPEGLTAAREMADRFATEQAEERHGCAPVRLYVYAHPLGTARAALARGWTVDALRTLGPRPDLWLPGSGRSDLGTPGLTSNGLLPAAEPTLVATTPLVLAVPAQAAPPDLVARRDSLRWAEALDLLDRLRWSVVRPDPALSPAGQLATVAMYASRGGAPQRLADPASASTLVGRTDARGIENRIADGLDGNGYPLSDAVGLLCHQWRSPAPRVALVVTEQQMVRFNAGRPIGEQCPEGGGAPAPAQRLLAVYPVDTLGLEYPLVTLSWPRRSTGQREWSERFRTWLTGEAGRQALNDAGLRPPARPVGHPLTEALGVLSGVAYPRVTPAPAVLDRVDQIQAAAQRPGRVLLALDASGSMRRAVGGATRYAVAAAAVNRSLAFMSDRDEFGLWVFQGSGRPPEELVPVGPGGERVSGLPRREATTRALGDVRPGGDTPLYLAIARGVAALGPPDPARVSALVVLTDGEDHGSGMDAADLVTAVRGRGVRVFVVAIGEASCATLAIREATRVTAGGCVVASPGDVEAELSTVFRLLWGGP